MSNFVIVGTQRSGTTLLRSSLDNHPNIRCLGEVFYINRAHGKRGGSAIGRELNQNFSAWRQHSYQNYIRRSVINWLRHYLDRAGITRAYLDDICLCEGHEACGFKLMANQLDRFPGILPYIESHGIRVVHMVRDDALAVLVSRLSLEARGFAHSAVEVEQDFRLRIDVPGLLDELRAIRDDNERWRSLLCDRAPYLRVRYEDFVADRAEASRAILAHIGVRSNQMLESDLKKLNTRPLSDIVSNFDDVVKALRGSEFEWCLDH